MANQRPHERPLRVILRNGTTRSTHLTLRPFRGHYELAIGASCEVRARGPATGTIEITQVDDGLVVTGWPGCILSVHSLRTVDATGAQPDPRTHAPTIALPARLRGWDSDGDESVE